MSTLLEEAEALVPLWDGINERIEAFESSEYRSLSVDERDFFDILSRCVKALRKTVAALVDRQQLMNEGAKGGRENPMSWSAYQQKEALYLTLALP